ncbi:hypothetical protein CTAYLR_002088 [Chrysophaeum taylorii]|uniref:Aminotransferase class I/classII large domain-containing protein n=1 Tax=Chrysophaeum taylorii TaxID=2483200 RepID=A0AAD7UP26_9STRA|nr:hypothetical protein CTAYLR_002088 [Chrysophaeum taylorii]
MSRLLWVARCVEFSALARGLAPSKTIEIHALTQRMIAAGEDVVSLSVGEPDFAPPQAVVRATQEAARTETRYTDVAGTLALRTKIAAHLARRKGTRYEASEIVVTNGAKQAVYETVLALCGPGDEVVIPAPYWVSYPEIAKLAGATPVVVETTLENGYKLRASSLRAAMTNRTKLLVLCNPCNPTGACLGAADLREIADVLEGFPETFVVADEIYERLHYETTPHTSFAALGEDIFRRTVVINGFSKAYAMTGYRLGYLAAPRPVAAVAAKIQGQLTSCASSISQAAGLAALDLPDDALDHHVREFKRRRDYVIARLVAMGPRILCPPPPEGAFYILPDISPCLGLAHQKRPSSALETSTAFCAALLEARNLALVPGDAFGAPGAIRISYATSRPLLARAMDALEAFVTKDLSPPQEPHLVSLL